MLPAPTAHALLFSVASISAGDLSIEGRLTDAPASVKSLLRNKRVRRFVGKLEDYEKSVRFVSKYRNASSMWDTRLSDFATELLEAQHALIKIVPRISNEDIAPFGLLVLQFTRALHELRWFYGYCLEEKLARDVEAGSFAILNYQGHVRPLQVDFNVAAQHYKQAGRYDEALRFLNRAKSWTDSGGPPTVRGRTIGDYFPFGIYRIGEEPLPSVSSVDLTTDADSFLTAGVAADLRTHWKQIAAEALNLRFKDDAFGSIVQGQQWQSIVAYQMFQGWHKKPCSVMKTLCKLLKGRMESETTNRRPRNKEEGVHYTNDEAVTLFSVSPGGWVPVHSGQDCRINVHLCLLNCEKAWLEVGGSRKHYYKAGELVAFHDALDHEIVNEDRENSRIIVHIAVLHPEYLHTDFEQWHPLVRLKRTGQILEQEL
eukprot:TRINITY_DN62867_c0_g1_i1.p1 TRINITY_DN62867_c0_g1~~TRINITY_DN62867_c0_g1_i1.p1  ORF type:complete len:428 (+),score=44.63 TRINITY_DN62867_c0_g1_i1:34-1317(+)